MKALIAVVALALTWNGALAQTADDCQDMVKLRDRSGSLALALGKIDTGLVISVTQNADFTSQFMTVLLFESQMCRLNQVLVARGQAPIARDVIDTWVDEINSAYAALDEATDGQGPSTITGSFNKARATVKDPWKAGGAKTLAYQGRLPANVSNEFLAAVPAVNLTTNVSGSAYLKTVVNKGFSGTYATTIANGEALVGNQLWALQDMRRSVGTFAAGTTPAATMLRDIINGVTQSLSQITAKRSAALLREQMQLDADAKAREAVQSTASQKIAELEKRIADVEKQLTAK